MRQNLFCGFGVVALVAILVTPWAVLAAESGGSTLLMMQTAPAPPVKPEMLEMNGIRLKDYADFEKKWKQVTVRFRTDTGEQRFTYANDIAYEALLKGSKDYPDGAVFAKIGIMTKEDPEFPSSKVPSGAQRIQFMVRDKKRYAATSGWGYGLFKPDGTRMDQAMPPEQQGKACDACHQIVKDSRAEVFSQLVTLRADAASMPPPPPPPNEIPEAVLGPERVFSRKEVSLRDEAVRQLPKNIRELLPLRVASVRFVEGALRDHVFSGTLNEIRPLLLKEAARSGRPALLLSRDGSQFTVVTADAKNALATCAKGLEGFRVYWSSPGGFEPASASQIMGVSVCIHL